MSTPVERDSAAPLVGRSRPSRERARVRVPGGAWIVLPTFALVALALLFALQFRLPSGMAVERAADLGYELARLALAGSDPGTAAERERRRLAVDTQLERARTALADAALDSPVLEQFAAEWRRVRADDSGAEARRLLPAAQALPGDIRARLDVATRQAEWVVKGSLVVLALLLAVPVVGLARQRRQVSESLSQFSDDHGSRDWQDAVQTLRNERLVAPSAFDALATGVAGVMGESDRRWQALADLSADWYWETDALQQITRLSGSIKVLVELGWGPEDVTGWRHDQVPFFRIAGGWERLQAHFDKGQAFRDVEFAIGSRDRRSVRWVSISGRARVGADGGVVGFEGVGRDITERKRSVAQLQASEQRWATMVRLASDWYWETDEQHRLLPLPAELRERFGAMADKVEGRTRWEAHPDALGAEQWIAHRSDLAARRPFKSLQMKIENAEGSPMWVSISGVPRFDASRRFRGYHGVGRDITARKEAERVLLRHNDELQRAVAGRTRELEQINRDLEAFARQLAHELRTPIGHVQGLAHLLAARAGGRLQPEDRNLLDLQVQAAATMRETVDALLHLARSTMQAMPAQVVDLSALAHEVIDSLPAMHRLAAPQWDVQPGIRVIAAPGPLKIVLTNLLGNAAKFTRHTPAPVVRIRAEPQDDGRLRIGVQDNGVGFDPAQARRLFTPFARLHSGEEYHGTGIGLTIVQRIVERHGGTVTASSQPGDGACFEFTLAPAPAAEAAASPVVPAASA